MCQTGTCESGWHFSDALQISLTIEFECVSCFHFKMCLFSKMCIDCLTAGVTKVAERTVTSGGCSLTFTRSSILTQRSTLVCNNQS